MNLVNKFETVNTIGWKTTNSTSDVHVLDALVHSARSKYVICRKNTKDLNKWCVTCKL